MENVITNMEDVPVKEFDATPEHLKDFIINLEAQSVFNSETWTDSNEISLNYLKELNKIYNVNSLSDGISNKSACILGPIASHMPKEYGVDYSNDSYKNLKRVFRLNLYNDKIDKIWTSATQGVDIAFALSAIEMRELGFAMKVAFAVPCNDFEKKLSNSVLTLYKEILRRSDISEIVSDTNYNTKVMTLKNEVMIQKSDVVYVTNGDKNKEILRLQEYAKELGKEIKELNIF